MNDDLFRYQSRSCNASISASHIRSCRFDSRGAINFFHDAQHYKMCTTFQCADRIYSENITTWRVYKLWCKEHYDLKIVKQFLKIARINDLSTKACVWRPIHNSILTCYFPKEMPCERINCAQCLPVLTLKNDAHGVTQFLNNNDKGKPFDPYLVIPSDALPTLGVERCLRPKDFG